MGAHCPELVEPSRLVFDVRKLERPDIAYGPGTDLEVELTAATDAVPLRPPRAEVAPGQALVAVAEAQPLRTMAGSPPRPADVINLAFSAADESLEAAFIAAGWTTAVARGLRADSRTVLAVAEDRGYKLGPVSWRPLPAGRRIACTRSRPIRSTAVTTCASGVCRRSSMDDRCGRRARRTTLASSSSARSDFLAPRRDRYRSRAAKDRGRLTVRRIRPTASRSPSSHSSHPDGQRHRR